MAAVSDVTIANLALSQLGDLRIISLNDDTKPAREVKAIYDHTRDAELRKHRWNFAITTTTLAALSIPAQDPYQYAYQAPADCLRIDIVGAYYPGVDLSDYRGADTREWSYQRGVIWTNLAAPLPLRYGARITDPTQFDTMFVQALACRLAVLLAKPLTGSTQERTAAEERYRETMKEARNLDAIEDPPEQLPDDSWVMSRI